MNILIVEDHPTHRKLLQARLEADGHRVLGAGDGCDALALLDRENVEAIISDILMPNMDGYRLCYEVRKDERWRRLPFIFYTSTFTSGSDEKLARDLTGDCFVRKPANGKTLLAAVHDAVALNHRRAVPPPFQLDDLGLLKEYSDRLVSKLEETNIELRKANEELRLAEALRLKEETERKRIEEQFVQAQKMEVVGHLAGGIAHDFNNILAVMMGFADLILDDLPAGNPAAESVEHIRQAGERAMGLTRQLLIFSRKEVLQPVVLDPNQVLTGLDKILRRLIGENIELTVAPGKVKGRVKADPGYLGQVLMNLVINARDAMPAGGKLTIETGNATLDEEYAASHPGATPGEYLMLAVSDTGTGMTDEVKARLFQPFFTTKPKGKGTGLGLATCQTIVKHCRGHLAVDSELGKGTSFKIYLPLVDAPLEHTEQPGKIQPLPRGTETVLVVEDDPALLQLTSTVLSAQGFTVLAATNGQEGLRVVRDHQGAPVSLVISDVVMPEMSGPVMVEWLTSHQPGLKVILTSGYTDVHKAHQGMVKSGVAFLGKPFSVASLARKVREVLDRAPVAPCSHEGLGVDKTPCLCEQAHAGDY